MLIPTLNSNTCWGAHIDKLRGLTPIPEVIPQQKATIRTHITSKPWRRSTVQNHSIRHCQRPKPIVNIVMLAFETGIFDVFATIWRIMALQSLVLSAK